MHKWIGAAEALASGAENKIETEHTGTVTGCSTGVSSDQGQLQVTEAYRKISFEMLHD
jgi:hypothetical protein